MTANLKRAIGRMNDLTELTELKKAIYERIQVLQQRAHAAKVAAAWERIKDVQIGATLHVCASGTFFGGPFQRGDSMQLTHKQPRAKRIWFTCKGVRYWMDAGLIERYDLRTEPPAEPMKPEQREQVERIAGRISESLNV